VETAATRTVALRLSGTHHDAPQKPVVPYVLEARHVLLRRGPHTVLNGVNLSVARGELLVLVGANGAGKTTLLQCLAGALRPTDGEVRWCGERAAKKPYSRRRVGFVGHERGLYLALTGWENLLFAGRMFGIDRPHERATDILSTIGLASCSHQPVGCLSRGMQQRLAIARATIHHPEIVILDEPFACLDAAGRQWLAAYLGQLCARGCGVVFSSHEVANVRNVVDRMLLLQAGRLGDCERPAKHASNGSWTGSQL